MATVPAGRLSELIAEHAAVRRRLAEANLHSSKLTMEHNRLVAQTDQMPVGVARQMRHDHAEKLLKRKIAAYGEEKALNRQLQAKEEEIADVIQAMWAVAVALNDPDLMRQLRVGFVQLSERVSKVEQHVSKLADEVNGLRQLTTQSVNDNQRSQETISRLRAEVARMSAVLSGAREDVGDLRSAIDAQAGSLAAIAGGTRPTIVTHDWGSAARRPSEPRSPEITPDELAALPQKITILLFASQSKREEQVDIGEELRDIQMKINDASFGEHVNLRAWLAARPFDLVAEFNRHKPQAVHFSGHGEPGALLLTGNYGNSEPVPVDLLLKMFRASADHLRMAFLNVCDSEEHAEAAAHVLDVAIGMHGRVPDTMARLFAAGFYSSLAFGASVRKAFEQGLLAVNDFPEARTGPKLMHRAGIDPHKVVLVRPGS